MISSGWNHNIQQQQLKTATAIKSTVHQFTLRNHRHHLNPVPHHITITIFSADVLLFLTIWSHCLISCIVSIRLAIAKTNHHHYCRQVRLSTTSAQWTSIHLISVNSNGLTIASLHLLPSPPPLVRLLHPLLSLNPITINHPLSSSLHLIQFQIISSSPR